MGSRGCFFVLIKCNRDTFLDLDTDDRNNKWLACTKSNGKHLIAMMRYSRINSKYPVYYHDKLKSIE